MRKSYPYLQNPYTPDLNVESAKRRFLSYIDDFVNQRQYVKMTLLDWHENPIKSIEGQISSGSISKDGSSAVRRTCNLSCAVDGNSYNVDDMKMDFTLNRKIFIEIGIKNDSPYYQEYPILWFPQGVFYIANFSMNSSSSTAVNLSLGLKDKMAGLNGDVGGKLPSTIRFDSMETQTSDGEIVKDQKVLIYNIIQELVNHFGEEDLNNIVIEDVPLRIRKIMRWTGDIPLYGWITNAEDAIEQWVFSLDKPASMNNVKTYEYGADVGYIYSDFVLTKELYSAPGDSVCTILDQLKNALGNYEYFFDEMGIFHFREIKNFLNVSQGEMLLDQMSENDYLIETTNEKAVFAFEDNKNITSITVTPQYDNIKNEYIVHGMREGDNKENATLIMYHLVIDDKPEIVGTYSGEDGRWNYYGMFENIVCYTDIDGLNKLSKYIDVTALPQVGNFNLIYHIDNEFYYWDGTVYKKLVFKTGQKDEDGSYVEIDPYYYSEYYVKDWRTYYYLCGLEAQINGTDEGIYFEELAAYWPGEYNLLHDKQDFLTVSDSDLKTYVDGKYFLDFIDSNSAIGKYSVSAIGRRSDVLQDDDINCLFEAEIPDIVFLNVDNPEDNVSENTMLTDDITLNELYKEKVDPWVKGETLLKMSKEAKILAIARVECINNGHPFTQVRGDIYSNLAIGGYKNSAFEKIKYELFIHTNFSKTVSLTSLPVFYLEPNSRVTISDKSTNTYGDFMVQTINITFGPGANMATTLHEVYERL